jgi:hypothetical protein
MNNSEIRNLVRTNRLYMWEVAIAAGISEPTLTRWMRTEMSGEHRTRVLDAIYSLLEQEVR